MSQKQANQPELHLLHPDEITFENIMQMLRDLTGRAPTPEEVEEARAEWQSDKPITLSLSLGSF